MSAPAAARAFSITPASIGNPITACAAAGSQRGGKGASAVLAGVAAFGGGEEAQPASAAANSHARVRSFLAMRDPFPVRADAGGIDAEGEDLKGFPRAGDRPRG